MDSIAPFTRMALIQHRSAVVDGAAFPASPCFATFAQISGLPRVLAPRAGVSRRDWRSQLEATGRRT